MAGLRGETGDVLIAEQSLDTLQFRLGMSAVGRYLLDQLLLLFFRLHFSDLGEHDLGTRQL